MRTLLYFISVFSFILLFVTTTSAQLQLEHTYPKGWLSRSVLDYSGECYSLRPYNSCHIMVYDSLHQYRQTLTLNAGVACHYNYYLSEKYFDSDPAVEAIMHWEDESPGDIVHGSALVDDDSTVLNYTPYEIFRINTNGPTPKAICHMEVFGVPDLQLEHDYANEYQSDYLRRLVLQYDGERYVAWSSATASYSGFYFFDASHQLVGNLMSSMPKARRLTHISQGYFNADEKIEFMGTLIAPQADPYGNGLLFTIIQEDSTILMQQFCSNANDNNEWDQQLRDLERIVLTRRAATGSEIVFIHPTTFETEAVLPSDNEVWNYHVLPDGTPVIWVFQSGQIVVYDQNYQIAATFAVPDQAYFFQATKGQLSGLDQYELLYTVKTDNQFRVEVVNPQGQLIRVLPDATSACITKQLGLRPVLAVQYIDSTQIYSLYQVSSTDGPEAPLTDVVLPNPFQRQIIIRTEAAQPTQLCVTNAAGQVVIGPLQMRTQEYTLPTAHLPAGVYWLTLRRDGRLRTYKMIKN
jgi:hypothetical protein